SSKGWGGLERNMLVMARWMKGAGHRVALSAPADSPTLKHAEQSGLDHVASAPDFSTLTSRLAGRRWGRKRQADILWIRDRRDLDFGRYAAREMNAALVMQQAMQIPRAKNQPWHLKRYQAVDAWVCGLEHLKDECLERTPLLPEQCYVLPLPLDARWFEDPAVSMQAAREALGLQVPSNAFLVGTVGRLDPGKGQRLALEALALLPPNVHWLFVGDNTVNNGMDERAHLQQLTEALGLQSRVHLLPGQDAFEVYRALDAFGMVSTSETIGTVTLEAMARRVPVIGSRAGGTTELLSNGRGFLFEAGQAQDLARAVEAVRKASDAQAAEVTRKARIWAEQSRAEELIPAWEELMDALVESRRKA
ncbi:MAG: glycosyltransferase family 4 protein, partial [Flavobacteriales bacterium]